jgi:hypothetical protein
MAPTQVPFKEVFTNIKFNYGLQPRWTISEMVEFVVPKIVEDFNIREEDLEIVANNQYEECVPVELLNALSEEMGNRILEEEYGRDLLVAFYVRRKNTNYLENNCYVNECIVCLNIRITSNTFGCRHQICRICSTRCRSIGHNRCPVCRQNLIGEAM